MRRYELLLGTLLAMGCSGRAIDVGPGGSAGSLGATAGGNGGAGGTSSSTQAGSNGLPPGDCTSTTQLPTWPDSSACVAASNLPIVGAWQGYVENQVAPWDQLTLVITGASVAGGVCGTLAIGAGTAPPPATDPNDSYPPGLGSGDSSSLSGGGSVPGFPLSLLNGTTDGTRVRFSVAQSEAFRSWCQLQTAYRLDDASTSCGCLPNRGFTWGSDPCSILGDATHPNPVSINCLKLGLCMLTAGARQGITVQTCACNASGCDGDPNGGGIAFDLRFTASSAEGSNTALGDFRTDFTRTN